MKYNNSYYMELNREICEERYKTLSLGARWMFVMIKEYEQRYCGKDKNWFFRSDEDFSNDMGVSLRAFKGYKKELKETGLVRMGYSHYEDENGKLSRKKISNYKVLV